VRARRRWHAAVTRPPSQGRPAAACGSPRPQIGPPRRSDQDQRGRADGRRGRGDTGHPPGGLAGLADSVLDLPEVRASARLEATVSLGDTEALQRLRERTKDAVTRPAGSTALVDAAIRA
jgi:hypothetical protein